MSHITWQKGGEADVIAFDGDHINVLSTTPSAPGSRPIGALAQGGAEVRLKVARCKKQDDRFLIEGRLLDAPRETRAEIARLLG